MLKTKNITLKIDGKTIVKNANFSINKSECIAIIGKNGAGKSTFVNSLYGAQTIHGGEIISDKKLNIGVVFQGTVARFVYPKVLIQLFADVKKINKKLLGQLIQDFDIQDLLNIEIDKLSSGQLQKLKLFLALLPPYNLLILDEMTSSLDYNVAQEFLHIIKKITMNGTPIILISHNIEEIFSLATHYCIMKDGILGEKKEMIFNKLKFTKMFSEITREEGKINDELY